MWRLCCRRPITQVRPIILAEGVRATREKHGARKQVRRENLPRQTPTAYRVVNDDIVLANEYIRHSPRYGHGLILCQKHIFRLEGRFKIHLIRRYSARRRRRHQEIPDRLLCRSRGFLSRSSVPTYHFQDCIHILNWTQSQAKFNLVVRQGNKRYRGTQIAVEPHSERNMNLCLWDRGCSSLRRHSWDYSVWITPSRRCLCAIRRVLQTGYITNQIPGSRLLVRIQVQLMIRLHFITGHMVNP